MSGDPMWSEETRETEPSFQVNGVQDGTEHQPAPEHPVDPEESVEFDPKHRTAFDGLLYLGYLSRTFQWMGHSFTIKTLNNEEILAVGQYCRRWGDTLAASKGYQTTVCAMALVSVDERPMPAQLGTETLMEQLARRYAVVKGWYGVAFDAIYSEYLLLEEQQAAVLEAMGKAHGQGPSLIPG